MWYEENPIILLLKSTKPADSIALKETLCLKLVKFGFATAPIPLPPVIVTIGSST